MKNVKYDVGVKVGRRIANSSLFQEVNSNTLVRHMNVNSKVNRQKGTTWSLLGKGK